MNQRELHKKIREILQKNPQDVKREEVFNLISVNFDAKNYFFAKADKRWLDWLWENGFLTEAIAKKAEDPTRYSYKSPELRYLVRMAEDKPAKVAEIISSDGTATKRDNFNPEVVDQFLRICSKLPAKELEKIVPKIKGENKEENWVKLMSPFNPFGFEYREMFKKLFEAKDYEMLLDLADVVLSIKTKEEYEKEKEGFPENPFYFSDFSNIKVFDYLVKIDDEKYIQEAFSLLTERLGKIIKLTGEKGKDDVFKYYDNLILFDVDFFELKPEKERYLSSRENIRELTAVITTLTKRLIGEKCKDNQKEVRRIFKQYIGSFDDANPLLPDSRAMWRLRLFALSLCPKVFKDELKKSFFRLLNVKRYHEIMSGAEYLKALRVGFPVLSDTDKHDYIRQVIDYFVKKNEEKEDEKENWHLIYGSRILSVLAKAKQLTNDEIKEAKKKGFIIKPDYRPEPPIKMGEVGTITPRSPINCDEFKKMKISEIVEKMKNEWSPKSLDEKYKNRDNFLHPINADGVVKCLKEDISERFQEYIDTADLFFDRTELDSHYTYSFLRGIEEYIRNHREELKDTNWDRLIKFLTHIKKSGEEKSFDCKRRQHNISIGLLADWTDVHSAIADITLKLLEERDGRTIIDFPKYRDSLFEIIKYLLNHPDPKPKDEQGKRSKISQRTDSGEYIASDPFTIAINSVRGQAFQNFVLFMYQDGKILKTKKVRIRNDVKKVYEEVLEKENTQAIMFMFGHYLPSFYFRDKDWIRKLLPKIFSEKPEKKNLYTAAWEGYLSANLYKQMFFDPDIRKLYERALNLTDKDYPKQKHFKDPDEALADHLALAFVHFPEFDFKHSLFNKFWKDRNTKRHKEFISFIGRHAISREAPNEWIKQNKVDKKKLKKFWNWVLEKISEPDVLAGFGFWINPNEEVLGNDFVIKKIAQTIEKSEGKIGWDYGLLKRLPVFAEVDPENTLKIIKNYLLDKDDKDNNLNPNRRIPLIYEEEIKSALEIICKNGNKKVKQETTRLINTLIEKGSSMFWELEDIIQEK